MFPLFGPHLQVAQSGILRADSIVWYQDMYAKACPFLRWHERWYTRCGLLKISCIRSYTPWSVGIPFVDLQWIDYQVFLQQRWVYLGATENCNLRSAFLMSHMQVSTQKGNVNTFIEGNGSGKAGVNTRWNFSLAESVFILGSAVISGRESSPFWFPNSVWLRFLFTGDFLTLFFFFNIFILVGFLF